MTRDIVASPHDARHHGVEGFSYSLDECHTGLPPECGVGVRRVEDRHRDVERSAAQPFDGGRTSSAEMIFATSLSEWPTPVPMLKGPV